jgi:hypothetical protein
MSNHGLSVPHNDENRGTRRGHVGHGDGFPEWDELITPEMIDRARGVENIPPRPGGLPVYGWTAADRVVILLDLSAKDWERVRRVTGLVPDGWTCWYPVDPGDRDRLLEERERLAIARRPSPRASSRLLGRRPPRVRRR